MVQTDSADLNLVPEPLWCEAERRAAVIRPLAALPTCTRDNARAAAKAISVSKRQIRATHKTVTMVLLDPSERLNERMSDVSDVHIGARCDAESYIAGLKNSLRAAACVPFTVSAKVVEPGFYDAEVGDVISGKCVARANGYWLVYQPEKDRFLCFWGRDVGHLSAPGILGSPLGCWSS